MDCHYSKLLNLFILALCFQMSHSWNWFRPSEEKYTNENPPEFRVQEAEFSIEGLENHKAVKLVQNARQKLVNSNSCWQNAYREVLGGCAEILASEDKRSRLAWHLSDCFQKESGRPSFPYCNAKFPMKKCLTNMDNDERTIYLEFLLETNSICYQLQARAFNHETERLVNDLKRSAEFAEEKLGKIEEKSDDLLRSANHIHGSLSSIDVRTQKLAQASKIVESHVDEVLEHSKVVYEQSQGIAASQTELQEGQWKMREKLEEEMAVLQDSYSNLSIGIDSLKNEAVKIEQKISGVSEEMSLKMESLQNRADDIGNMAGISLDKQKELLDGQSVALKGLQFLREFQSEALEESRRAVQQLAEFGHQQQDLLLHQQEQLQQAHNHLVKNSKSILAAQEAFESKQETMFVALDRLFTLQSAMLVESRLIKAFFVYMLSIFILYMFTGTKQTYAVRPRLYLGLCGTFLIEFAMTRLIANDMERQAWIINCIRMLSALLASVQLLYAIYAFRDYESLNHQMLLTLTEKVDGIRRIKEPSWPVDEHEFDDHDDDDDVIWNAWVDTDLAEDIDSSEDPDYMPPEVHENSTAIVPRKYNLRHWSRR